MKTITTWVMTKKGNQFQIELPAKHVVCPECDGCGKVLRGGLRGAVIDQENLDDPDFCESYFGGDYDVRCDVCNGENVILELDYDRLSQKMKDRVDKQADHESRSRMDAEGERRWGC